MELPVGFQAAQLLRCLLAGVLLGLQYDLLRAVRRRHPRLTPLLDLSFVLPLLPGLLLLALYVGQGRLRLFMLFALAAGALAYFATLSRLVLRVLARFSEKRRALRRRFRSRRKKISENVKKSVAIAEKSVIIKDRVKKCAIFPKKHGRRRTRCGSNGHLSGSS